MPPVNPPIVIAHRGASGYLPEHTLPSKAYAHAVGADFLEQDVVLTKDDVPVVLHDIHLDTVSDVATRFPGRSRADGRYYAIDFTWTEIQLLRASERFHHEKRTAIYEGRFPIQTSAFSIPSLEEELEFISGLNKSTGRTAGIYPEIKQPAFHRKEGKDISRIVLDVLARTGWDQHPERVFVQCFEAEETRRIRQELKCPLPLIQLFGNEWKELVQPGQMTALDKALDDVRTFADGIGPALPHLLLKRDADGFLQTSPLVEAAHQRGLKVHPWTIRRDELPKTVDSLDTLHSTLFLKLGVDGAFSDFPDATVAFVRSRFA